MTALVPLVAPPQFYDRLAGDYWSDFEAPHRKAYDTIAWDRVCAELQPSSTIVDVGCGVGRWAKSFVEQGHQVIGIEPSSEMVRSATSLGLGSSFVIQETDADGADIAPGTVDVVVAMGSIQYAPDPDRSIARMASWLAPEGRLWVLVDGLQALVTELIRRGDHDQAIERATSAMARFSDGEVAVEHHLYTADRLERAFVTAGLTGVEVGGLLVDWMTHPREVAQQQLTDDWDASLRREHRLAAERVLADGGKQLLAVGLAPS